MRRGESLLSLFLDPPHLKGSLVKKLALLTLAAALAAPTLSQAQQPLAKAGITVGTLGNPFFVPLNKGAEDGLKATYPKVDVTIVGADYDINKQASQIDNFIAMGAKIIVLNAVDPVGVKPFVAKAKAAGIVVAAMDVGAEGADLTVMTNNVQAGEIACADLAKRLGGKGDVLIINGPQTSSIVDRVNGCKKSFAKHPGIKILSDNQDGKASREGGLAVMQAMLTRYKKIDAVFGANDPTAIGADLAAKQLGRKEMIIAGVDGSPDVVVAMKTPGSLIVNSASQDPYGMARKASEMAVELLNGKKPAQQVILLDTKLVTKENVGNYVGWDAKR
jgi:ribose transport system substrate-binding protein